jgi:hypothetical protein
MKRKSIPLHEPTEAEIQHAAYLLWIEEGQPEGRDLEHWLAAKELLRHRHARAHGAHHRPAAFTLFPAGAKAGQGNN